MKPPQGMGIVVATMDIQNWGKKRHQNTLSALPNTHTCAHSTPFPLSSSSLLQESQKGWDGSSFRKPLRLLLFIQNQKKSM